MPLLQASHAAFLEGMSRNTETPTAQMLAARMTTDESLMAGSLQYMHTEEPAELEDDISNLQSPVISKSI